jgi:2-polyprenyl-6-hydroxyphenyl methylase/3-demethylubiquinone-9 3-methyltransferase
MWSALYRLLAPGGRIIVTTPNYFHVTNVAKELLRCFRGRSSGIPVEDVVGINTYAHHWKLYSVNDIKEYFRLISPDFAVGRVEYFTYSRAKSLSLPRILKNSVEDTVKFLREALYVEIGLPVKTAGIVAKPGWWQEISTCSGGR